jgi:hypothetical protein
MFGPPFLGVLRHLVPMPMPLVRLAIGRDARRMRAALAFMSPDHHRVRDFVVTELPRAGHALAPDEIAAGTGLPRSRVDEVVAELERRLTFLYRTGGHEVDWAYPVTVDATPHRLTFNTGERLNAA